jgi:tagatose 6-phosphate kinase
MILAVSLNPALDKYLRLARLERGGHLEAKEVVASAGGKAVNVAGVLRVLGETVELCGFFGGVVGDYLLQAVALEGVVAHPVRIQAQTRTAFVLVEDDGTETEVVEPGGAVAAAEISQLRARLREAAERASVVVLSGSVPPGCPDDIYVRLLADCAGRPAIVDSSRAPLRALLDARSRPAVSIIKPNRREAEAALGRALAMPAAIAGALREFAAAGVALPVISDGAAGLYALAQGEVWHARPPRLQAVNSVGSGDAAVAGLAVGLARGWDIEPTLRLAAACGAANVLTKECAGVRAGDVARLGPEIQVARLPD